MRLEPLGDQAVLAYCDDESGATRLVERMRKQTPAWCLDVVQAYVSVAIYYDASSDFFEASRWLRESLPAESEVSAEPAQTHLIPCCYELGLDLERVAALTGLDRAAIIAAHSSVAYTVYAIGFCPGFPYLGYLPSLLTGVPRLDSPRLQVDAGSIGLTGRQTGIYTEARPGGWNIVGKTPLQLVDVQDGYFPLRTGDQVRFQQIDEGEYQRRLGERLE